MAKVNGMDIPRKEPTVYSILQRLSVAVGLLAMAPLTRIWDQPWWLRVLFVMVASTLIAATTYDLLPHWSRRWPFAAGVAVTVATIAAWAPGTHGTRLEPRPATAGRATIASPLSGQLHTLAVREAGGYTDGFTASGTCEVPEDYRAVIVSRADIGPGYWLLSDGILADCVDDNISRRWTAERVDPSWPGMRTNHPVTIGVIILRKDLADRAQAQKVHGEPLDLPRPAASTLIRLSRVQ